MQGRGRIFKGPGETEQSQRMTPQQPLSYRRTAWGPEGELAQLRSAASLGVASGVGGPVSPEKKIPRGPNPQHLRMGPSCRVPADITKTKIISGKGGALT